MVGIKRVHRIWRREGLKVPHRQPKRGRLWLNDGSCIRLRPTYPNHVWSYDFVEDRTHNGRKYHMLNIIDEFTRECLAIRRRLKAIDVIDALTDLFILRGIPGHIRSDGPEFVAKALREWIGAVRASTAYIEPGSPWENGYCESFNSKLRDQLLNGEIFYTPRKPKWSSKAGADTTILSVRIRHWAIDHPRRRRTCGRLTNPLHRRRQPRPWRKRQSCTNIKSGPPNGGRPARDQPFCAQ